MSASNPSNRSATLEEGFAVVAAIVLCCLIVGTLSFSWGRESERDTQRAAEYQDYGERRESIYCSGMSGVALAQCQMEQEEAAKEAYQSERDLEAQRDMSLWALAMFIISAVTAGLTLWALIYVRGTLVATREALRDTADATKAMVNANRIAINAQRPWIDIDPIFKVSRLGGNTVEMHVRAEFRNVGNSLASSFRYAFSFEQGTRSDFYQFEQAMLAELSDVKSESSLIPGKSITSENLYGGMTEKAF